MRRDISNHPLVSFRWHPGMPRPWDQCTDFPLVGWPSTGSESHETAVSVCHPNRPGKCQPSAQAFVRDGTVQENMRKGAHGRSQMRANVEGVFRGGENREGKRWK